MHKIEHLRPENHQQPHMRFPGSILMADAHSEAWKTVLKAKSSAEIKDCFQTFILRWGGPTLWRCIQSCTKSPWVPCPHHMDPGPGKAQSPFLVPVSPSLPYSGASPYIPSSPRLSSPGITPTTTPWETFLTPSQDKAQIYTCSQFLALLLCLVAQSHEMPCTSGPDLNLPWE